MKIINREQVTLNSSERETLAKIRKKKTLFLVLAYMALIFILVVIYLTGFIKSPQASVENIQHYRRGATILTGSCFIVFTCVFIIHYFRSVYPYTRDINGGVKTISWFYPSSYKTPFFDNFFLKTGSRKKPMLSIPKHLYDAIQPGVLAFIAFAPASRFVLLLDINGLQIEFNDENSGFEL
jgi:hypothetical protein